MRTLRGMWFHLRDFAGTPYFIQLVTVGTISACVIQRLGVGAWGTDPYLGFARSCAIGLWTSCTASAGIIGFERRKGTLVYLLSGAVDPLSAVAAVVSSASTFGLCAFPIAWAAWSLPGRSMLTGTVLLVHLPGLLLGAVLLWIATMSVTFVIATVFILTPNALVYEGLVLVPCLALSGVFDPPSGPSGPVRMAELLLPPSQAVRILYSDGMGAAGLAGHAAACLALTALWTATARRLGRRALCLARRRATIEVM